MRENFLFPDGEGRMVQGLLPGSVQDEVVGGQDMEVIVGNYEVSEDSDSVEVLNEGLIDKSFTFRYLCLSKTHLPQAPAPPLVKPDFLESKAVNLDE